MINNLYNINGKYVNSKETTKLLNSDIERFNKVESKYVENFKPIQDYFTKNPNNFNINNKKYIKWKEYDLEPVNESDNITDLFNLNSISNNNLSVSNSYNTEPILVSKIRIGPIHGWDKRKMSIFNYEKEGKFSNHIILGHIDILDENKNKIDNIEIKSYHKNGKEMKQYIKDKFDTKEQFNEITGGSRVSTENLRSAAQAQNADVVLKYQGIYNCDVGNLILGSNLDQSIDLYKVAVENQKSLEENVLLNQSYIDALKTCDNHENPNEFRKELKKYKNNKQKVINMKSDDIVSYDTLFPIVSFNSLEEERLFNLNKDIFKDEYEKFYVYDPSIFTNRHPDEINSNHQQFLDENEDELKKLFIPDDFILFDDWKVSYQGEANDYPCKDLDYSCKTTEECLQKSSSSTFCQSLYNQKYASDKKYDHANKIQEDNFNRLNEYLKKFEPPEKIFCKDISKYENFYYAMPRDGYIEITIPDNTKISEFILTPAYSQSLGKNTKNFYDIQIQFFEPNVNYIESISNINNKDVLFYKSNHLSGEIQRKHYNECRNAGLKGNTIPMFPENIILSFIDNEISSNANDVIESLPGSEKTILTSKTNYRLRFKQVFNERIEKIVDNHNLYIDLSCVSNRIIKKELSWKNYTEIYLKQFYFLLDFMLISIKSKLNEKNILLIPTSDDNIIDLDIQDNIYQNKIKNIKIIRATPPDSIDVNYPSHNSSKTERKNDQLVIELESSTYEATGGDFSNFSLMIKDESIDWDNFKYNGIELFNNVIYLYESLPVINKLDNFNIKFEVDKFFTEGTSEFGNIKDWDVSNVTDMSFLFLNKIISNDIDISGWDVSNVKNMKGMFNLCQGFSNTNLNWSLSTWNTKTENVENMSHMFQSSDFNHDISNWTIYNVKNTEYMFSGNKNFNGNINKWITQNLDTCKGMFKDAVEFNSDISNWRVNSVKNMSYMFDGAIKFNKSLQNWNIQSLENADSMFKNTKFKNINCDDWNTSNVTNMKSMFENNEEFNDNISGWNTENVLDMRFMFRNCKKFSHNIKKWKVDKVKGFFEMFKNATLMENDYNSAESGYKAWFS